MTVIVAGSGASGLVAAIAAAAEGADVLLLERSARLGGTTALGGGRVWVPANHCPENSGDSPEAARAYLDGLFPARYAHMTEAFVANAPVMARFVGDRTPHRFAACARYPDYHPDRPGATLGGRCLDMLPVDPSAMVPLAREVLVPPGYLPMTHAEWERWRYPDNFDWSLLRRRQGDGIRTNGVALAASLTDGAVRAGVRVRTSARLTAVTLGADGAVARAIIEHGGGTETTTATMTATAVILATGGFDWDENLRRAWHPAAQRATGAAPGNTGDALRIACRLGAATDNLAEGWWMPMMALPGEELDGRPYYRSLIRERAVPRQIMVNAAGRRFTDEASPYNDVGKAMHGRDSGGCPNDPAYMIFDSRFLRRYPLPGVSPGTRVPGWVASAQTPARLASLIGVDPDGLERTVAEWNKACGEGADPEFGRGGNPYDRYGGDPDACPAPNLGPLSEPPLHAVRVLAGTIGTKGGPVTDANGMVLTGDGTPLPGLYAVGNAAAFWTGDAYPAPGATLGIGMTMGYLAGRHAAARLPADRDELRLVEQPQPAAVRLAARHLRPGARAVLRRRGRQRDVPADQCRQRRLRLEAADVRQDPLPQLADRLPADRLLARRIGHHGVLFVQRRDSRGVLGVGPLDEQAGQVLWLACFLVHDSSLPSGDLEVQQIVFLGFRIISYGTETA
jgi:3-oxosteroid 1-dehydrogenase